MLLKIKSILLFVVILSCFSWGMDNKTLMHIVSIPLLDGAGIYTSVRMLNTESVNNKASAITSLSLLGVNAGLGALTMVSNSSNMSWTRKTHRIVGFIVTGASLWMAASAMADSEIRTGDKVAAGLYTGLTIVPLVMFSF